MAKMSTFTELDETTFSGTNDYICGYQSDLATTASNFRIKADDFLLWSVANMNIATIDARAVTVYDANNYLVGFDSTSADTIKINLDNLLACISDTQAAIADAETSHATSDFAGVNTALNNIATKLNSLLAAARLNSIIAPNP
jgi:hypothetical protein